MYSGIGSASRQGDKVLNVAISACIDHFDPAKTVDRYSIQLLGKSYERLLSYRSTQESVELGPNLVESMLEASGDGRVYTFRLRKWISFHDDRYFVDVAVVS